MNIVQKEVLSLQDKEVLCELWNNEYPEKLSYQTIEDFNLYLDGLINTKHYLLIDDENKIKGWVAIILDEKIQGNGFGSLLIKELKKNKTILNGWAVDHENDVKRNKEFYKSPLMFYIKNGFTICENSRIENQKISAVKINWKL
jgi:GNAT superfamily N-acetyltransferase